MTPLCPRSIKSDSTTAKIEISAFEAPAAIGDNALTAPAVAMVTIGIAIVAAMFPA